MTHMSVQPGFTIASGGYTADIARTGAALRGLRRDGVALTEEWPLGTTPPVSAGVVLAPWPGRTEDGIYTFGGEVHRLTVTHQDTATANHGLVRAIDWDDVEIATDALTLAVDVGHHPGWPYDLHLRIRYAVGDDGLSCSFEAHNTGTVDLPFVVGFHTYLRVGATPIDDCTLELGARRWQPLDERLLPTGPTRPTEGTVYDFTGPAPLAGVQLDTPFTATDNRYVLRAPNGEVTLWTDDRLPWAQVFTAGVEAARGFTGHPAQRALAVEPMSGPGNALHTGTDVATISPGGVWACSWGIR
ncbi:Aldose 1-epimerase OS=Tsukamurella paurometabola (strain ATCC 8368 / DSM / CCUG 35730 / CIP 100753 / JCM 10117 / KCTC 9821 / NBRC 16120 / NCIMB 702349 /NCTC 13040) OX=521096 GN=Tpau_0854 PE=4 SV=1 [Tsukamurella paurometabola]|uniref:Aldose 1-epimerase n=2 Tax=Tsukamurella paurometabola TaxID=2061 RepID=D5UUB8_TSUPD|nr:Aldose 1-epimerase [Tsukamurella paurometabola DSM 20162]SUP27370.1 putative aldose-1-epimerase [Tsukamurella paurometabola]